jgi:hypothetical protein
MNDLKTLLADWFDPHEVSSFVMGWSGRVLAALAIFVVGRIIARALSTWLRRAMQRVGPDETLSRFFGNLVYTGLSIPLEQRTLPPPFQTASK